MIRFGVICFFILFSEVGALALQPASPEAAVVIQNLIDRANDKQTQYQKTENDIRVEQGKPLNGKQGEARDPVKLAELNAKLPELKAERDRIYRTAIMKTLVAYDIVDHDADGLPVFQIKDAVSPQISGRKIEWIPVYKDNVDRVILDNKAGTPMIPAGAGPKGGITGADGVTTMYGTYLFPADLALMLYHEHVHFEQFTTPGVGDRLNYYEREEAAYRAQYRNVRNFGLTPEQIRVAEQFYEGKARENNLKAQVARASKKLTIGLWGNSEPANIRPRPSVEYIATKKDADDFIGQLRDGERALLAKTKKDANDAKEAAALRLAQEILRSSQRHDDPGPPDLSKASLIPDGIKPIRLSVHAGDNIGMRLIRAVASDACSSPPQSVDHELGLIQWSDVQKVRNPIDFMSGLSPCELRVFQRLMDFSRAWAPGATIGADSVRAAAAEPYVQPQGGGGVVPPTQSHDPVWSRVNPIIGR